MSLKCKLCGSTDVVPDGHNLFGDLMYRCNNCKEPGVWYIFEEATTPHHTHDNTETPSAEQSQTQVSTDAARSEFVVKDSGNREQFDTGAVRDTADDKPRPDLISPFFLVRLGEHMRKGAIKYCAWNWAKGIPSSRCFASCMRHLMAYAMGKRDEDHLSAAAFNIMAIIHNEEVAAADVTLSDTEVGSTLNDMPRFKQKNIK